MTSEPLPEVPPASAEPAASHAPAPAAPDQPSRAMAIVGFVLSFFVVLNIAGLVLSIIATVRSRRAGRVDGFAVAGIAISGVGILTGTVFLTLTILGGIDLATTCARLGDGVHHTGAATYTCGPQSGSVRYGY